MSDQKRRTSGQWINGKWVTGSISPVEGADDTSATTRAALQDVSPLAAAARKAREAREKKAKPTPRPTPRPTPDKVSMMDDDEEAMSMATRALRNRYRGGSLGALMGRG